MVWCGVVWWGVGWDCRKYGTPGTAFPDKLLSIGQIVRKFSYYLYNDCEILDKLSKTYYMMDKLSNNYDLMDKLSNAYNLLDRLSNELLDKTSKEKHKTV